MSLTNPRDQEYWNIRPIEPTCSWRWPVDEDTDPAHSTHSEVLHRCNLAPNHLKVNPGSLHQCADGATLFDPSPSPPG